MHIHEWVTHARCPVESRHAHICEPGDYAALDLLLQRYATYVALLRLSLSAVNHIVYTKGYYRASLVSLHSVLNFQRGKLLDGDRGCSLLAIIELLDVGAKQVELCIGIFSGNV